MKNLQTITVHQAPILFLARGLGSALDAQTFYNIVAAEFPAPILEPTLRKKAASNEDVLLNSVGKPTEFTKYPASNIENILSALKFQTDERGGDIYLGTISNVEEAKLVKIFGVKGGISPEHFPEVVTYALENGIEYFPALKNIEQAYALKQEKPAQRYFKFFPFLTKKQDEPIIENFTPAEILAFAKQNPDVIISITGGIKTKDEIKSLLRLNYELGCADCPRVFVGMGIYAGAPEPIENVRKDVLKIGEAIRELEAEVGGQKLGKLVQAKTSIHITPNREGLQLKAG